MLFEQLRLIAARNDNAVQPSMALDTSSTTCRDVVWMTSASNFVVCTMRTVASYTVGFGVTTSSFNMAFSPLDCA